MAGSENLRPYDKEEWQARAMVFLLDPNLGASPLDSAAIALSSDDPELAEKCREEAKYRRYGNVTAIIPPPYTPRETPP